MCLAVPGKILETKEENGSRIGRVQFGGITRLVQLDFVPEAEVGDYVIVHVGFALSKVNAEEAQRTYELLQEIGLLEEVEDSGSETQDSGVRIQDSESSGSGSPETKGSPDS
jgi:hydrogenase expression/formation protein HypC